MIVRKQRRLVVRMGQYESHEVVGEVTVDTNNEYDRGLISGSINGPKQPVSDWTEATAEFLDGVLEEVMAADVEDAHYNTADEDSFIHDYHKQHQPNPGR